MSAGWARQRSNPNGGGGAQVEEPLHPEASGVSAQAKATLFHIGGAVGKVATPPEGVHVAVIIGGAALNEVKFAPTMLVHDPLVCAFARATPAHELFGQPAIDFAVQVTVELEQPQAEQLAVA